MIGVKTKKLNLLFMGRRIGAHGSPVSSEERHCKLCHPLPPAQFYKPNSYNKTN